MRTGHLFPRILGVLLILVPLCVMGILTLTVLFPALKEPESKIYHSSLGYPALKRLVNQPIKVETATVEKRELDKGVAASGESVALQEVEVLPLVSGKVKKVYVVEGQWVRRGTPLVQIDQTAFEYKVNNARNNLIIAQVQLSKLLKNSFGDVLNSQASVDKNQTKSTLTETDLTILPKIHQQKLLELESSVKVAQELLEIAQKKLSQFQILHEADAVSLVDFYKTQEEYKTRQKELIIAQQQLAQEKLDKNITLNQTKKEYADNQEALITSQQELNRINNTQTEDIEIARLDVKNRQISLREAMEDLNNTRIYANIDGLVSRVKINAGEVANINFSLITLNKDIVFKAYIDQAQINTVNIGDIATVRLVAYPGQNFSGKVIRLNPTITTEPSQSSQVGANRQYTYSIWIKLNNPQMPSGLQGYAQINKAESSLVIPESSLTHLSAGEGLVMIIENDKAVIKKVKIGRKFDNQRELLKGLNLGDKLILYPGALNPGDSVKPQF